MILSKDINQIVKKTKMHVFWSASFLDDKEVEYSYSFQFCLSMQLVSM